MLFPVRSHPYPEDKSSGHEEDELDCSPRSQLLFWGYSCSERDANQGSEQRSQNTTEERLPDICRVVRAIHRFKGWRAEN